MTGLASMRRCAAIALLTLGSLACGGSGARPRGIILITLDTTRADHLGCYGDTSAATPNLDALAKEGARFEQAMTAVPTTLPSHATMFTGVYPPAHGVRYNGMFKLGDASVTIAERLKAAGFVTGAVPASYPVNVKSGLSQGFDTYKDLFSEPGSDKLPATAERSAADVVRLGLETIRAAGPAPFFVWLHIYDPHYPYQPPFPFSSKFREHPYDGEIAYADKQLGELFAALEKDGLWDGTAIVVAGDHGEGLYEHGERMHAQLTYQSTMRVPLIVKAPGVRAGIVVGEPVSLADLTPTLLDLANLPIPTGLDGVSLRGALSGKASPPRSLYFESYTGSLVFGWSPLEGLRRGKWKLIRGKDLELYDLDADADEKSDRHGVDAGIADDLRVSLDESVAHWAASAAPAEATQAPVDAEARARLAAIGYIGGTISNERRGGPDPRTVVHLESELLLLQDLMTDGKYKRVLDAVPAILEQDPTNRLTLQSAAEASAATGDLPSAERYVRKLLEVYPEFVPAHVTLGRIQVAKKDFKAAESVFRDGVAKFPGEPTLVYSLALCLVAENKAAEAEPLVAKALAQPNPDPGFYVLHAVCRAIAGDEAGAEKALGRAMANGYTGVATLRSEPLLAPLRQLPGFEKLIAPKKAS